MSEKPHEPTQLEHIECKRLTVVDDNGLELIRLSTDRNSGRIDITQSSNEDGNAKAISLHFRYGMPEITITNEQNNQAIILMMNENGGAIQLTSEGKTKALLWIDENQCGQLLKGSKVELPFGSPLSPVPEV